MSSMMGKRHMQLFVFWFCTLFPFEAFAQTDSAVLASAIKNGRTMSSFFLRKNTTITVGNTYYNACSWYGMLHFGLTLKDTTYLDTIQKMYKKLLTTNPSLDTGMVDSNAHGILPFELYRETGYVPFLTAGKRLADDEFSAKHLRPDTLSTYSRFWIDDMYMIGSLQTQAWKNIDSGQYLNNDARTLSRYIDSNQQPVGLLWHSTGTPKAPYFWGRGNGWAASSMTEILQVIPATHPLQAKILAAYVRQMQALLKYQGTDGMWHQLLDDSTTFKETSCTGMFIFSLATGLRLGWISGDSFRVATEKGWTALTGYLDSVNGLKNVCPGFGANASRSAYVTVTPATGDPHGTAGFLWAANAMVQLLETPVTEVRSLKHSALPKQVLVQTGHVDSRLFDIRGRCIGTVDPDAVGRIDARGWYLYHGRPALRLQ